MVTRTRLMYICMLQQERGKMVAAFAALPPDSGPHDDDPGDDRWGFEPDPGETFQFDPEDDRKWDAFLLDEDDLEPRPDEFVPL